MIPAHTGQLAAIQFSPSGTKIATASDKGTVIRVFSVSDGTRSVQILFMAIVRWNQKYDSLDLFALFHLVIAPLISFG